MVLAKKKAVEANRATPFWESPRGWVRLYQGDVREALALLPARSVHCVVTSPPYWGLRDYGVDGQIGSEPSPDCGTQGQAQCGRCFVCSMVAVFREVRRVLRDDGTLWLNLGDTYASGTVGRNDVDRKYPGRKDDPNCPLRASNSDQSGRTGLPSGNLVGVPWRVALALQADGWVLRQDIIEEVEFYCPCGCGHVMEERIWRHAQDQEILWKKPSPMPESVRNRCTKAHEYVFLMTKSNRYFYDAEAIKENVDGPPRVGRAGHKGANNTGEVACAGMSQHDVITVGANKRSVWSVASQGFPGAHFATFPPNLIRPMILAGTSERGCCASCGAPWRRVVEERKLTRERPNDYVKRVPERPLGEKYESADGAEVLGSASARMGRGAGWRKDIGNTCANSVAGVEVSTVGWEPTCECPRLGPHGEVVPCVVLDPFVGSGTVPEVAAEEGRRSVGIDLSADYLRKFAVRRAEEALKRLRDPGTGLWVIDGHARPVVEAPSARGPGTVRRIV
jgi:DNA modification methylase